MTNDTLDDLGKLKWFVIEICHVKAFFDKWESGFPTTFMRTGTCANETCIHVLMVYTSETWNIEVRGGTYINIVSKRYGWSILGLCPFHNNN